MSRRLRLATIAHNRRLDTDLSNEAKSVIHRHTLADQTDREIALAEGLKQPTIKSIIRRASLTEDQPTKPRRLLENAACRRFLHPINCNSFQNRP